MRRYPNTPMPDIPSPAVPVLGVHFLLPGEAFSPMELCFPELIGPLAKPRGIPKEPRPHATTSIFKPSSQTDRPLLSHNSVSRLLVRPAISISAGDPTA